MALRKERKMKISKTMVEGAKLVLKTSKNPKEIKAAQEVIKKYREQEGR